MKNLIGGVLTVALVGLLIILFVGITTLRYDLITIQQPFWFFVIGIVFLFGGGWLVSAKIRGGTFFAGLGTVLLVVGGYKATWPNTAEAIKHAQITADEEAAKAIRAGVRPRIVPCDRTTKPPLGFFDQGTSTPIIWVTRDPETGRLICRDRAGFDPFTQQKFVAVDKDLVAEIMSQDPPITTAVATAPQPSPSFSPTALPVLDEGDITEEDLRRAGPTPQPVPMIVR